MNQQVIDRLIKSGPVHARIKGSAANIVSDNGQRETFEQLCPLWQLKLLERAGLVIRQPIGGNLVVLTVTRKALKQQKESP